MAKKSKLPRLQRRIRAEVDSIPVVDVHTHLGTNGLWQAQNLAQIVSYHWVRVELARAARRPIAADPRADPDGFMEEALPLLHLIRNTSNHYALMGILRDLYGLEDRTITPKNWRDLDASIRAHSGDPTWVADVLTRANVVTLAVEEGCDPPCDHVDWLLYAPAEPFLGIASAETLENLRCDGPRIETADLLEQALCRWVDGLAALGVGALHAALRPHPAYLGWSYVDADPMLVDLALCLLQGGEYMPPAERRTLNSFCERVICQAAGRHGMVVQLFHGTVGYAHAQAIQPTDMSYWDPDFLQSHTRLFHQCPDTRFDLFLGTRIPSHEAVRLSRVYPNVSVSGAWWHAFTPTTMQTMFRDRLEGLPLNAWNAFFSDAYLVEWVYGKLLLTRHVLSGVLADMAKEDYLTENDAAEVAHSVLYANPLEMYGGRETD